MSPQHLCSSLRQAENSLACLYITPKGFALHAALLSFSIDAQNFCPEPSEYPLGTCAAFWGKQKTALLVCAFTPMGFALHTTLL